MACPHRRSRTAAIVTVCGLALLTGVGLVEMTRPDTVSAQTEELPSAVPDLQQQLEALTGSLQGFRHRFDILEKKIDDVLWFERVGDVAWVDKVRLYGPPRWKEESSTAIGAGNPIKFYAYVIIPKQIDRGKKFPLLVFPHGGVHGDFSTYYIHIVRELVAQGYVIIAPEYRGSTGYGQGIYERIDYGGLESEDAHACRNYMLENYSFVDKGRVGMIGWSHGGLISLMNIFAHPDDYRCAYVGVPVSDLISRLGYLDDDYRELYSADYHIGQEVTENIAEYRRRSPVWNAEKLKTPLLIHTNTNDEDVNVLEVEHLIHALTFHDKEFAYEIYQDVPGGHSFDRLDTRQAQEIRLKIYRFLAEYLKPPRPLRDVDALHAAGYR